MKMKSVLLASALALGTMGSSAGAMASIPDVEPLSEAVPNIVPHSYQVIYASGVDQSAAILVPHNHRRWSDRLDSALSGTGMAWSRAGDVVTISAFGAENTATNSTADAIPAPLNGLVMVPYSPSSAAAQPGDTNVPVQTQSAGLMIAPYTPSVSATSPSNQTTSTQTTSNQTPSTETPSTEPSTQPIAPTAPTIAAAPLPPPPPIWVLPANSIIADDLKDWGKQAGWAVLWQLPESPVVPAPASISGDFQTAVTTVVKALHDQGISIRVRFYTYAGANTAVLTSDGTPDNAQVGANVDSSSNN